MVFARPYLSKEKKSQSPAPISFAGFSCRAGLFIFVRAFSQPALPPHPLRGRAGARGGRQRQCFVGDGLTYTDISIQSPLG